MKKLLVFLMASALSLSLMGCGGSDSASTPANNTPTAEEQLAQEQAKADADHAQIVDLAQGLTEHEDMIHESIALVEKYKAGEVDVNAVLDNYKERAEHAQAFLDAVNNAQWQTEYYKEPIELLTATYQTLADAETVMYEASVENDEAKLAKFEELFSEYQIKCDEFLTSMGV